MKYISSRGAENGLTFEKVLFSGYAKDGGLYFPESIPKLTISELQAWKGLSYPEIVLKVMRIFIDESEIPTSDLENLVQNAFKKFSDPQIPIKMANLENGLVIAEMFHGPTMAFKDLALGVVGQLYEYFLARSGKQTTVLIGTSGDTGSAAINAVRGMSQIDVVVLLPKGRCTEIQELQMTTVLDSNVHNFAVDGTSDDLDVPIKAVFADIDYVAKHDLCSINSINWARILVQIGHFIYCYLESATEVGEPVELVVPTGACGNIASGFVAHEMGVPLKLVAAVTPNDIVHRALSDGDFSLSPTVLQTWATAMDIQVPYNVERIMLMACGLDTNRIAKIMAEFESQAKTQIPRDILERIRQVIVDSASFESDVMLESVKKCFDENGYVLCPHTAVGVAYHYNKKSSMPQVVIATASPAKFPEAVSKAGVSPRPNPDIEKLFSMPTRFDWMRQGENWEDILRHKIEEISEKRKTKTV